MLIMHTDVIKYGAGSSTLCQSALVIANRPLQVTIPTHIHVTRSHCTGAYYRGNPTDTSTMRVKSQCRHITRRFNYWVAKFLSRVFVNATHETIVIPDTLYNGKVFLATSYHVPRLCKVYDIFSNQWTMENKVKQRGRCIHEVYQKQHMKRPKIKKCISSNKVNT
jgi:hypothetical protein